MAKKYAALIVSLFLVFSVFCLHRYTRIYLQKPDVGTWSTVNQFIYQKSTLFDAVVFFPQWLTGYATDFHRFGYVSISGTKELLAGKRSPPAAIWLIRSVEADRLAKKLEMAGYQKEETHKFLGVVCEKYRNTMIDTLYDFGAQLNKADAWIENPLSEREMAQRNENVFSFATQPADWNNISLRNTEYSFGQERINAIWFHPPPEGKKILKYPSVPLGNKLVLQLGLADSGRNYDYARTCYFTVFVEGALLDRLKLDEGNPDQYWEFDTQKFGPKGDVVFQMEGSGDITRRHVFFLAKTVEDRRQSKPQFNDGQAVLLTKDRTLASIISDLKVYRLKKDGSKVEPVRFSPAWMAPKLFHESEAVQDEGGIHHRWDFTTGFLPWNAVAQTKQRSDGKAMEGIWAHPTDDAVLTINADSVRFAGTLKGFGGFTDTAMDNLVNEPEHPPVNLKVFVDGLMVLNTDVKKRRGWQEFKVPLRIKTRDQSHRLTVEIRSRRSHWEHFVFDLWSE